MWIGMSAVVLIAMLIIQLFTDRMRNRNYASFYMQSNMYNSMIHWCAQIETFLALFILCYTASSWWTREDDNIIYYMNNPSAINSTNTVLSEGIPCLDCDEFFALNCFMIAIVALFVFWTLYRTDKAASSRYARSADLIFNGFPVVMMAAVTLTVSYLDNTVLDGTEAVIEGEIAPREQKGVPGNIQLGYALVFLLLIDYHIMNRLNSTVRANIASNFKTRFGPTREI
jgi:hypothetical protein